MFINQGSFVPSYYLHILHILVGCYVLKNKGYCRVCGSGKVVTTKSNYVSAQYESISVEKRVCENCGSEFEEVD